ncbi:MAG: trypsin-like serine peptidase [Caulobacteraceae bacterium]
MTVAMTVDLMSATVQLEQPLSDGTRTVATGFLVSDPTPDGRPRVVLITADHVFEGMPSDQATIGYRVKGADGAWTFAPRQFPIRAGGKPLWTRNPTRDVAAIVISAPPEFTRAAIPLAWVGGDQTFAKTQLTPGEEMMTLGFPQGLSANPAGFPILRSGRVASYPLGPSTAYPTFLLDFRVFPGNSGGPVWLDETDGGGEHEVIAGMLTQQVQKGDQNLGIGIVTQAQFIRDTIALLDAPTKPAVAPVPVVTYATDTAAGRR